MLGTLEEDQKSDWKTYIPTLVHANATRQENTGFSPHYLMFGRNPRLAVDAFLDAWRLENLHADRTTVCFEP